MGTSLLGLGSWVFGGGYFKEPDHKDTLKTIHAALRGGITHYDTAQAYGNGRAEQIIGQQLRKARDQVSIASKTFFKPKNRVEAAVDLSLRRLHSDYIDLFYIHWPVTGQDMRPMMEGLEETRRKGKIRLIGVSNFSVDQLRQVMEAGTVDVLQIGYNLFWRWAEQVVIPFCRKNRIALITYSSLAQGILAAKFPYELNRAQMDRREKIVFFKQEIWPRVHKAVEELRKLAQNANCTAAQLAILWTVSRPWVTRVLVGARTRQQIEENMAALKISVSREIIQQLTAISDRLITHIPYGGNIFMHTPRELNRFNKLNRE